ncbi:MAG TPA: alkaline phosphatase family protein [Bryobacteraceae bacterium]|nr:alkaline phosphatase family protein [Bryobacteraceae bacterium]
MAISRRRFAVGTLAGLAGCLPDGLRALRPRPKLFVFIIAEQFRQIYLDRVANRLSPGGFRELLTKGIYYPNCGSAASGFTASGLATLATGAYPQVHGIVADQWWDRRTRAMAQARSELLEATTLADEAMRATRSRIFALGLTEGPTSLLAGRSRGQVFWMNTQAEFKTRGNIPEWLTPFNDLRSIESLHDKRWNAIGAGPDTPPLRTLTYDPKRPQEFLVLYQSSPYCQEAQFDLLQNMLAAEKLGQGDTLDFVFLALESIALLGYETGSDSPLMEQMTLQLDAQVQRILDALNKSPGKGNYNLIFAAAHGAPPEPDPATRSRTAISGENLARAIDKGLSEWVEKGPAKTVYVDKYVYPFLYLKLDNLRKQNTPPRAARKVAGELALRLPGVAGYYTADGDCSHTGDWRRRFENSFNELRSGDVMISYDAETVEDFNAGRGVSYGSLYNYDTRVPLFLYGPQFGRKQIERAIEAVSVAPTVARAALIAAPSSCTGEVLAEAFAEGPEDGAK